MSHPRTGRSDCRNTEARGRFPESADTDSTDGTTCSPACDPMPLDQKQPSSPISSVTYLCQTSNRLQQLEQYSVPASLSSSLSGEDGAQTDPARRDSLMWELHDPDAVLALLHCNSRPPHLLRAAANTGSRRDPFPPQMLDRQEASLQMTPSTSLLALSQDELKAPSNWSYQAVPRQDPAYQDTVLSLEKVSGLYTHRLLPPPVLTLGTTPLSLGHRPKPVQPPTGTTTSLTELVCSPLESLCETPKQSQNITY